MSSKYKSEYIRPENVVLVNVDNTADVSKPVSSFQLAAFSQREYTIEAMHLLLKDTSFTWASVLYTTMLSVDPQSDLSTTNLIATGNVAVSGDVSGIG